MGGDRSVSCCTSQVLSILVGDVLTCTVLVAFGETEINDIDVISSCFSSTNQEVVWLDIPVDDAFLVYTLDMTDKLEANVQNSL